MVFILLALVACQPTETDQTEPLTLRLIDPVLQWREGTLGVVSGVEFVPSVEILDALEHGVAVTILVATRVHPVHGVLASADETKNHRFEIRYLPLSQHYQLTELKTETSETYPRFNMLTSALAVPRWLDTHLLAQDVEVREWHVQAMADIDRERLPAPMQVAVWSDANWRSSTDWSNWRVADAVND